MNGNEAPTSNAGPPVGRNLLSPDGDALTQPALSPVTPTPEDDANNPNESSPGDKASKDGGITPLTMVELKKALESETEIGIIDDKDLDKIRKGTIQRFHSKEPKAYIYYSIQFQNAKKFEWVKTDTGRFVDVKHVTESEEDVSALQVQIPQDEYGLGWAGGRPYVEQGAGTSMDVDPAGGAGGGGGIDDGFDASELERALKLSMMDQSGGGGGVNTMFAEDDREAAPSPTGANPNARKGRKGLSIRWEDQQRQQQQATTFASRDLSKLTFDLVLTDPTTEETPAPTTEETPAQAPATEETPAPTTEDQKEPQEAESTGAPANSPLPDEEDADDEAEYPATPPSSAGAQMGDHEVRPPSPREMIRASQARQRLDGAQPDFLTGDGTFYAASGGHGGGLASAPRLDTAEFLRRCREKKVLDASDHLQADIFVP